MVTVRLILDADTQRSLDMVVNAGKYMLPVKGEKKAAKEPAAMMQRFSVTVNEEYAGCSGLGGSDCVVSRSVAIDVVPG